MVVPTLRIVGPGLLSRVRSRTPLAWALALSSTALLLAVACDGDGDPPGDGGSEGEGEGEAGDAPFTLLSTTTIDAAVPVPVSGFAITARPDGRFVLAWFEEGTAVVRCEQASGAIEGPTLVLKLGDEQPDGSVRVRVVDPAVPTNREDSVDIATAPDGAILIAYNGGTTTRTYCGASDLLLAVEDDEAAATFSIRTVAQDAATTTPCRGAAGGDPYCAEGSVVGLFPGVATNAQGQLALAYLDTHFGFADTDIFSSDAELAFGTQTSLTLASVQQESGAGYFGSCVLADDGRVLVGHAVVGSNQFAGAAGGTYVVEDGIYAQVVNVDGVVQGGENPPPLLPGIRTDGRVATAFVPGRGFAVAVHARGEESLQLFLSGDDGLSWSERFVEQLGRSGRDPGLVALADGRLVVAYGHCRDDDDDVTCDARRDGVRLAVEAGARFAKTTLPGDAEDHEGIGVDVARSGDDEIVIVDLNASQNRLVVRRVRVH
jgi:hypothetical protein